MTDFSLSPRVADIEPVDSDLALVAAFLAGELAPAQAAAVEERLAMDIVFYNSVASFIRAWTLAPSFAGPRNVSAELGPVKRGRTLIRIAAVFAVFAIPIVTSAQVVVYVANHPGTPGHAIARRLLSPWQQQDTIVRNAGAPRYPGMSTLTQELSIGAVNGPDAYLLGDISQVAVGHDGKIFAMDRSVPTVRVYDSTGRFVRNIGRGGDGPADFRDPGGMAALADGRLLVWEARPPHMIVMNPEGSSSQWNVQPTSAGGTRRPLVVDPAGAFVYADRRAIWFKFRTSDGAVVDSIREPAITEYPPNFVATQGGRQRNTPMPWGPPGITTFSPLGYVVSAVADRYAFEIRPGPRGVVSIRRDVAPIPIPERSRDSARAAISARMKEIDPAWTFGGRELPRTMPYFLGILVGLDGRIWLQRDESRPPLVMANIAVGSLGGGGAASQPDPNVDFKPKPIHFDVFEPGGAFIGQVELPASVTLKVMRGDKVWGVAKDDDGVQYVRRYRINWR